MYESPIKVDFTEPIIEELKDEADQYIVRACQKMNVNVDREELIRALQYDRDQYLKGYTDAMEELSKRVPKAPHGRLIDADALKASLVFAEKTADWAVPALRAVLMVIDEMPTIIPAEEGET